MEGMGWDGRICGSSDPQSHVATRHTAVSRRSLNQRWHSYKQNLFRKKITIRQLQLPYYVHIISTDMLATMLQRPNSRSHFLGGEIYLPTCYVQRVRLGKS